MSEGIAIVGIACRYPDADSPRALWENVLAGRRAFRRLPPERLDLRDYLAPDGATGDGTYCTEAALIEGFELDRVRHRVTGEAYRSTDLAHWLALDVASRALDDAGHPGAAGLPKATTGVVVGNTLTGEFSRAALMRLRWPYVRRVLDARLRAEGWPPERRRAWLADLEAEYKRPFPPVTEETLAGGLANTIAGRVCNVYDLGGGGFIVDGACSSSLLAVAQACSALVAGDLDVALAGGVDLSLDPFELVGFARLGALARDEMRVYDRGANGFWPGEGCGFVVLMRDEDARAAGAHRYAVIRGWGVSSDGHGGITRPEAQGQRLALERAYRRAGYPIGEVALFEGHGTGTPIGDPTELRALVEARRASGPAAGPPAAVGSIKANIGHTKAAAGVAGLVKAVMAVHEQVLPPAAGCERPHPVLEENADTLRVLRKGEPWPREAPLHAGVSAFGFGGINAHVTVAGVAERRRTGLSPAEARLLASAQDAEIFLLEAPDRDGLAATVARLLGRAAGLARCELTDLAAHLAAAPTAARTAARTAGPVRAAVVAATPAALAGGLDALARWLDAGVERAADPARGAFLGRHPGRDPRLVFLFPGQASPVRGDGGAWARRFAAVEALYENAEPVPGAGTPSTAVAQPAIVRAELAGLRVLGHLGVRAAAAVGHSVGELTALHWAGAMNEERLLELARTRGRAMDAVPGGPGAMASLVAGEAAARALCSEVGGVVVAALNAPDRTVVSGAADRVAALVRRAGERGIQATPLSVAHAFHSPLMAPAAAVLAGALAAVPFQPLARRVHSTITGGPLPRDADASRLLVSQLTEPVRFAEALAGALEGADAGIEVGPGAVLAGLAAASEVPVVSVDAAGDSLRGLLEALALAHVHGAALDRGALFAGRLVRPFDPDRVPRFLVNPCERAPPLEGWGDAAPAAALTPPVVAPEPAPAPDAATAAAGAATAAGAGGEPPVPDEPVLERLRRRVAARAELPVEAVTGDLRMLADLHLNSIAVAEVVTELGAELGLTAPVSPTDYADASVAEIAGALESLAGGEAARAEPDDLAGVGGWVRSFAVHWVPAPRPRAGETPPGGDWRVHAPDDHPLRERLTRALVRAGGGGVAVLVPPGARDSEVPRLLAAAREVRDAPPGTRLVVVQHGGGAAAFARTVHLETPGLVTCVVDLPADARAPRRVAAEVRGARGYHEVRYDAAGTRTVPRLRLVAEAPAPGPLPLGEDDVALVSGGARGIGAECAAALARASGARLVLLGRSDPTSDPDLAAHLERLRALGVRFRYLRADVTDAAAVREALRALPRTWREVTALVHAAGVNHPALAADLDPDAVRRTCAPKVSGLDNLLGAIDAGRLRLLVGFGSIIARMGVRGEADYALANDWLAERIEAFGHEHPGCRCLTIEWSVWSGAGMGERLGRIEALARSGVAPITLDRGVEHFLGLLAGETRGAVVVASRIPDLPTLALERPELPFRRFLEHPRVHFPGVELVADASLSVESDPYLDDHVLGEERIFPAVMGLEAMAQAVAALTGRPVPPVFEAVEFAHPVVVGRDGAETVRVAALASAPGVIDVALRCARTRFKVDHFRARCRTDGSGPDPVPVAAPAPPRRPLGLDAREHLYGRLLFHTGRFRRLGAYRHLDARRCGCEVLAPGAEPWFARYLPAELLLADPGARDAALHAVQACIPHARLLPVAVERIVALGAGGASPRRVEARERWRRGDRFCYDVELRDGRGRVREVWRGLELARVEDLPAGGLAHPALLAAYAERRLEELMPGRTVRLALAPRAGRGRRAASGALLAALAGDRARVRRRFDGRPEAGDGATALCAAHADGLTLGVAGPAPLACDLELVRERPRAQWARLLGAAHFPLAELLAERAGEPLDLAATRVWAARECLKKAGAQTTTPLTLEAAGDDGWVMLGAGPMAIATYLAERGADPGPVALTVLAARPDAGV